MDPLTVGIGLMGASALGSLLHKKKGGGTEYTALETPEQREARARLLKFATGDPSFKGPLGSYDMTGAEELGQNQLLRVLQSGRPEMFGVGERALTGLMEGDAFDPYNEKGSFTGFRENVLREGQEASDRLRRGAAMAGNLYSTDTIKRLGDIEGDTVRALTSELGRQYDTYTGRKIAAIPTAFAAGQAEEGLDLGRVSAAMQFGGLDRALEDKEFKDAYQEFIRSQQATTGALGAVAGQPQFSAKPIEDDDPWSRVLDMLAYGGGIGLAKWATA